MSDHPDQTQSAELRTSMSQMSFPISSGHSDTDRPFSLFDTAFHSNSPPYTDDQVYSESAYFDEIESSATTNYTSESQRYVPSILQPPYTCLTQIVSARTNGKSMLSRDGRVSIEVSATYQRVPEVTGLYNSTVPGGLSHGHGSTDIELTPRDHPLYQNTTIDPDGLYHCPWEGKDPACNHKPEKLKCNYE